MLQFKRQGVSHETYPRSTLVNILSFFSCVLEVSLEKILALETEVPHWSAKQFLEDGM